MILELQTFQRTILRQIPINSSLSEDSLTKRHWLINNNSLGCLYEGGKLNPYEGIIFTTFEIK